jgi:hypothetical protein
VLQARQDSSAELQLIEKVAVLEKKLSDNEVTINTMKKEMKALRKDRGSQLGCT